MSEWMKSGQQQFGASMKTMKENFSKWNADYQKKQSEAQWQQFQKMNRGKNYSKEWFDKYKEKQTNEHAWDQIEKGAKQGVQQMEDWINSWQINKKR